MFNRTNMAVLIFALAYIALTVLYFFSETSGNFKRRAVNKITLAVLFLAFFSAFFFKKDYIGTYGAYQIVGLVGFLFAFLGDIALLWSFMAGGVLFIIGNISLFIYELLIFSKSGISPSHYWWCLLIFAGLMTYMYSAYFTKRIDFGKVGIAMPVYVTSVTLHGSMALGMLANASLLQSASAGSFVHFTLFGLGLFLFMVSDYFLTAHEFVNKNNWVLRCNSGTYFIGMMLAAISFAF